MIADDTIVNNYSLRCCSEVFFFVYRTLISYYC